MVEERRQDYARIGRIEQTQWEQHKLLVEVAANTACLPKLLDRVDSLEASRDKRRGGIWVLGILWTVAEGFFHFILGHGK